MTVKRDQLIHKLREAQEAALVIPKLRKAIWELTPDFPFIIAIRGIVHGATLGRKTYCGVDVPIDAFAMANNHTEIVTCRNCIRRANENRLQN